MDELARNIGWWVIIGGAFYVVGKFILSHGEAKQQERDLVLSVRDHERRLAYRRIWQSTDDPKVQGEVKFQYGPWALLDLELNDHEYNEKHTFSEAYQRAVSNVKAEGYCCSLRDGKIVQVWGTGDA